MSTMVLSTVKKKFLLGLHVNIKLYEFMRKLTIIIEPEETQFIAVISELLHQSQVHWV